MPAGFCTRRWTLTGIVGVGGSDPEKAGAAQSPRTIRSPRTLRQVTEWIRRPLSLVPEDSSVKAVALHRFVSTLLASRRLSHLNRQQISRATNRGLPKAKAIAPIIRLMPASLGSSCLMAVCGRQLARADVPRVRRRGHHRDASVHQPQLRVAGHRANARPARRHFHR